ncbi:MAG: hypothetical protein Q8N98_01155 [bacterium]|nr:hypothetical protein [bacterium]
MIFLIFIIVSSPWTWMIFSDSFFLGVLVFAASLFFYRSLSKDKIGFLTIAFLSALLFFQYQTTEKKPLTYLSPAEQEFRQSRIGEYPASFSPFNRWIEKRPEAIAVSNFGENFFESIDLNLYFFANHPRERAGVWEFEKLPFLFLPFFLYGLFLIVSSSRTLLLLLGGITPIIFTSIIGNTNPLGPFSLFPVFVAATAYGVRRFFERVYPFRVRPSQGEKK